MYLVIPHSAPHRGSMALPFGSFTATYTEPAEKREALLELFNSNTGKHLATLNGEQASDSWLEIEAYAAADRPDVDARSGSDCDQRLQRELERVEQILQRLADRTAPEVLVGHGLAVDSADDGMQELLDWVYGPDFDVEGDL